MHKAFTTVLGLIILSVGLRADAAIPASEREALLALYDATDGAHWSNNYGWLGGSAGTECTWRGVTCDAAGTTVVQINLIRNELSGTIPSQIADLRNLQDLDLSLNHLRGPIPPTIGTMTQLVRLGLAANELSGSIPVTLGDLPRLQDLSLLQNQLTGSIPATLGNISSLQRLSVGTNQLTGTIPIELGQLTELNALNLGGNQLSGEIPPELAKLSKLQTLDLYLNQLTGTIPPEFAALSALTALQAHHNQLTGEVPAVLATLHNIEEIGISHNQFAGPIPDFFGDLPNLTYLHLGWNQLTGEIPSSLARASSLERLYLSANRLRGNIPPELGSLRKLTQLWVNGNQLAGEIDPALQSLWICYSNCLNLHYNALYATDADTAAWLTRHEEYWNLTQTVAPSNVSVSRATETAAALQWTPIPFSSGEGRYEVWVDDGAGPVLRGSTTDKQASSITVSDLTPGVKYTFALRTITEPHAYNQNQVTSDFSTPVRIPEATLSIGDVSLHEGDSGTTVALLPVTLPITSASTITVQYKTGDGTAVAGTDYRAVAGTLAFSPGETTRTIAVEILGDTSAENDESFTVALFAPVAAEIADGSGIVTIVDDDTIPDPIITITGCSRVLGPCTVAGGSASGASVDAWLFSWTTDGVPSGSGASFDPAFTEAGVHSIGLTASNDGGSASATRTILVLPLGQCPFIFDMPLVTAPVTPGATTAWLATRRDLSTPGVDPLPVWGLVPDNDADGIVTFTDLSGGFDYGLWTMIDPLAGRIAAARLDRTDCYDQEPSPFPPTIFLKNPNGDYAKVQARATVFGDTSFMWLRPGTGAWGRRGIDGDPASDLDGKLNGVILFETSSMEPVSGSVAPPAGGIKPGDYFIAVDLGSERWYGGMVDANFVAPQAGVISFSDPTDHYVNEDAGSARVRLERSGGSTGELTIVWSLDADPDWPEAKITPMQGVLTFEQGETVRNIELQVMNNPAATGDATYRLTLIDDYRKLTGPTMLKLIVVDRQTPPQAGVVGFADDLVVVREDAGVARVKLIRVGGSAGEVSVRWHTETETAVPGLHFEASSGIVVFAAGETSGTIEVPVIDNAIFTGEAAFQVVLTDPNGTAISGRERIRVIVNDTESIAPGVIQFANEARDVTVAEDAGVVRVELVRTGGSEGQVSVRWRTIEGSAVAELHYQTTAGVATFAHRETTKVLEVPIRLIPFDTGSVRFEIALSDPVRTSIVGPPTIGVVIVGRHGAAPARRRPVRRR